MRRNASPRPLHRHKGGKMKDKDIHKLIQNQNPEENQKLFERISKEIGMSSCCFNCAHHKADRSCSGYCELFNTATALEKDDDCPFFEKLQEQRTCFNCGWHSRTEQGSLVCCYGDVGNIISDDYALTCPDYDFGGTKQ